MRKIFIKFWYLITQLVFKLQFSDIGKKSVLIRPLQLDEVRSICIEDSVYIADYAWLMGNNEKQESMRIKQGTTIGHFAHIIAMESVLIEEGVLIADKVFISDCTHEYENINLAVEEQKIKKLGQVTIGKGSWLGENVCVCGASIGKHCVIGANSVVTIDIPDYCIAVGSPARVVKMYNFETHQWEKTF